MFSISQTSRGFFCLEWSPTETGPRIINNKHIKSSRSFSDKHTLSQIVSNYKLSIKDESNSLSVIINSDDVIISCMDTLSYRENNKMINWYESNIMGDSFCSNFYNYYFPMAYKNKKRFLIVSLPKSIRKNVIKSSSKLGFNLVYLSIDIFSSAVLVQNLYKPFVENEYLLWKICNNNHHTLIHYKENLIYSYVKIRKHSNQYIADYSIGDSHSIKKSVECLNAMLIDKKSYKNIDRIFIYQTKNDTKMIKNILDQNYKNLELLSLDKMIDNSNSLKSMNYVENGICFQGLDL